jgi:hypothetical protein
MRDEQRMEPRLIGESVSVATQLEDTEMAKTDKSLEMATNIAGLANPMLETAIASDVSQS